MRDTENGGIATSITGNATVAAITTAGNGHTITNNNSSTRKSASCDDTTWGRLVRGNDDAESGGNHHQNNRETKNTSHTHHHRQRNHINAWAKGESPRYSNVPAKSCQHFTSNERMTAQSNHRSSNSQHPRSPNQQQQQQQHDGIRSHSHPSPPHRQERRFGGAANVQDKNRNSPSSKKRQWDDQRRRRLDNKRTLKTARDGCQPQQQRPPLLNNKTQGLSSLIAGKDNHNKTVVSLQLGRSLSFQKDRQSNDVPLFCLTHSANDSTTVHSAFRANTSNMISCRGDSSSAMVEALSAATSDFLTDSRTKRETNTAESYFVGSGAVIDSSREPHVCALTHTESKMTEGIAPVLVIGFTAQESRMVESTEDTTALTETSSVTLPHSLETTTVSDVGNNNDWKNQCVESASSSWSSRLTDARTTLSSSVPPPCLPPIVVLRKLESVEENLTELHMDKPNSCSLLHVSGKSCLTDPIPKKKRPSVNLSRACVLPPDVAVKIEKEETFHTMTDDSVESNSGVPVLCEESLTTKELYAHTSRDRRRGKKQGHSPSHGRREDCTDPSLVAVGARVAIYWDGEGEYFKGTVLKKSPTKKAKPFFVKYDDGDKEWTSFVGERFRLLSVPPPSEHKIEQCRSFEETPLPHSVLTEKESSARTKTVPANKSLHEECIASSDHDRRSNTECDIAHDFSNEVGTTGEKQDSDIPKTNSPELNWVASGLSSCRDLSDSETDEDELLLWASANLGTHVPIARRKVTTELAAPLIHEEGNLVSACRDVQWDSEWQVGELPMSISEKVKLARRNRSNGAALPPLPTSAVKASKANTKKDKLQKRAMMDAESEQEAKRIKEQARPLTAAEIRLILGDDGGTESSTWVRRSVRQPSKSTLNAPRVKALLDKLRSNDSDMVVLKMKKYCSDLETPCLVIDAVLDALEENTNCEALYIQVCVFVASSLSVLICRLRFSH